MELAAHVSYCTCIAFVIGLLDLYKRPTKYSITVHQHSTSLQSHPPQNLALETFHSLRLASTCYFDPINCISLRDVWWQPKTRTAVPFHSFAISVDLRNIACDEFFMSISSNSEATTTNHKRMLAKLKCTVLDGIFTATVLCEECFHTGNVLLLFGQVLGCFPSCLVHLFLFLLRMELAGHFVNRPVVQLTSVGTVRHFVARAAQFPTKTGTNSISVHDTDLAADTNIFHKVLRNGIRFVCC